MIEIGKRNFSARKPLSKKEEVFSKIYRICDVAMNCTTRNMDSFIASVFANNIASIGHSDETLREGYMDIYVKLHKNSQYPEKRNISITYSDWKKRVEYILNKMEDK